MDPAAKALIIDAANGRHESVEPALSRVLKDMDVVESMTPTVNQHGVSTLNTLNHLEVTIAGTVYKLALITEEAA